MDIDKELWQTATTRRAEPFRGLPLVRCTAGNYAPLLMVKVAGENDVTPDPKLDYWTGTLPFLLELANNVCSPGNVYSQLVSDHIKTVVQAEMASQQKLRKDADRTFPVWLTRHVLDPGEYLEKITAVSKSDGICGLFEDPFTRLLLQDKHENVNWFRSEEAARAHADHLIRCSVCEHLKAAQELLETKLTVKETKQP